MYLDNGMSIEEQLHSLGWMVKWGILNAPYFRVLTPKVYLLPEFEGPSSKTRQLENGLKMGSIRFINKKVFKPCSY